MNRISYAAAAALLMSASFVSADTSTEQVQRTLKEQGFYYGEITGQLDTDTAAAVRRYQIRNGLKVTGELDAETRKSLGVSAATSPPKPAAAPTIVPQPTSTPDASDLRDQSTPAPQVQRHLDSDVAPPPAPDVEPETTSVFAGSPFEAAPPQVQQRIVVDVQTLLARAGYYRSDIDGVFGAGTAAALRAYQDRVGLAPTGRLDTNTLGALGILPGQNRRGFAPRRRFYRPPEMDFTPEGEPIYRPR